MLNEIYLHCDPVLSLYITLNFTTPRSFTVEKKEKKRYLFTLNKSSMSGINEENSIFLHVCKSRATFISHS